MEEFPTHEQLVTALKCCQRQNEKLFKLILVGNEIRDGYVKSFKLAMARDPANQARINALIGETTELVKVYERLVGEMQEDPDLDLSKRVLGALMSEETSA